MTFLGKGHTYFRAATKPSSNGVVKTILGYIARQSGYRQLGLRADDLIPEENDVVQTALKRLSPKETYDRIYRLRRAFQLSLSHQLLPAHEQTKPKEDYPYLSPMIAEIEAEIAERHHLDSVIVERRKKD